jgi:hypothetical protein
MVGLADVYRAAVGGVRRVMEHDGVAEGLIATFETGMLRVVREPEKAADRIRQLCTDYHRKGMNDRLVGALVHATTVANDEEQAVQEVLDFAHQYGQQ